MRKYDTLVKKVQSFEKLAIYGKRESFLNRLAQALPYIPSGQPTIPESIRRDEPSDAVQFDFKRPTNNTKPQLPAVPKEVQAALNFLGEQSGNPYAKFSLNLDGALGPKTRDALDWFRKTYNVASNFADKDVFEVVLNTYERTSGKNRAELLKPQTPTPTTTTPDATKDIKDIANKTLNVPGPKVV